MAALLRGLRAGRVLRGLGSGKTGPPTCWGGCVYHEEPVKMFLLHHFFPFAVTPSKNDPVLTLRVKVNCHWWSWRTAQDNFMLAVVVAFKYKALGWHGATVCWPQCFEARRIVNTFLRLGGVSSRHLLFMLSSVCLWELGADSWGLINSLAVIHLCLFSWSVSIDFIDWYQWLFCKMRSVVLLHYTWVFV